MISLKDLEKKMSITKDVLITLYELDDKGATEIWIKFKDGTYIFIDFEQPFPNKFRLQKLVGKWGNSLNCSENKKDMLIQLDPRSRVIIERLQHSMDFRANIEDTVIKVIDLISKMN